MPVSLKLPAPVSAPYQQSGPVTIDYVYDPLYRLKEANYSNGDHYHYTYDAVGNRLTQQVGLVTTNYVYDNANRLTSVDGVPYTWDNNGNLLNDSVNTYAYDSANRLVAFNGTSSYAYNGMGDRLQQTVNGNTTTYALDLNAGLTQVLNDGTNQYLYGVGRIAQVNTDTLITDYFLTDALGSVRQLTDAQGEVTLANAYEPYGVLAQSAGSAQTSYGFTGEFTDLSGMVYLRARYYMPNDGRFLTRDTWMGDENAPMSFNLWNYVQSNPVNYADPSGYVRTNVNCNQISFALQEMRRLCIKANGDADNPNERYAVLSARQKFFNEIAGMSISASGVFGEGYWWAGILLAHFTGNSDFVNVRLGSNSSFQSDRGILRATKLKLPQSSDDAKEITPLLHVFLQDVKRRGICDGLIPDLHLNGMDHYVGGTPRPSDTGWWGAFGHVVIDADYTNSRIFQKGYGYYINTTVNYTISDQYVWGNAESTPLPLGGIRIPPVWNLDGVRRFVGSVDIPHEWEVSLVKYRWANQFNFQVTWTEQLTIIVPPTFSSFTANGLYDELK